jgi:hypothetical protein
MTTITTPAVQVPEPLATDAAIASAPAGPCVLCSYPIRRGDRYARAVPSGRLAHVVCIVRGAGTASSTARQG